MENLKFNEEMDNLTLEDIFKDENISDNSNIECSSTDIIEYKEIDEPCVALTIIGENRLTNAEIFVKRGFKFSIKAFFSTIVLTILNIFI